MPTRSSPASSAATTCRTVRSGSRASGTTKTPISTWPDRTRAPKRLGGGRRGGQLPLNRLRRHHVLVHPEVLGLEAQREAHDLRQVQDRDAEVVALDELLGVGLLHVEVEV